MSSVPEHINSLIDIHWNLDRYMTNSSIENMMKFHTEVKARGVLINQLAEETLALKLYLK